MIKTEFQKIIRKNKWLLNTLNREKEISTHTLNKASKWENIMFRSKFKIYAALLELWVIDINTKTLDLFETIDTWVEKTQ